MPKQPTRAVRAGSVIFGGGHPIVVQSMCATKTQDIPATVAQIEQLRQAGAGIIRVAVDSPADAQALIQIRQRTAANLAVDLQENFRLAAQIAPHVNKVRYNPGHLYHHQTNVSWQDKVRFIADVCAKHGCALRVGVNCGSIDPSKREKFPADDKISPMLESAWEHCEFLDRLGFSQYCVSLKESDPQMVIEANRRFAATRPDVPLHLGVTEAGMPPEGIRKTRAALIPLLAEGIGDTIRVSLTLPNERKHEEVLAGLEILADVAAGRVTVEPWRRDGLNIVSCPSCSRVENAAFVQLAEKVRELAAYAANYPITIAVMGCRVNGPGETDDADLGLWCGPKYVNLKKGPVSLGSFTYEEILPRLKRELDLLIAERFSAK
ncbi:MAG: (E)-4-hydroxy-3-methylbut-2-enyl-diphosphate synthase [Thermogutta sp.]